VFVSGKPFQASLSFASKPGAYLIEAPFRLCTIESGFWPYPHKLD